MTELKLTAKGRSQELILAYLQKNASDVLAKKINSGTPFEKDGKKLINKKTLDGFMNFANGEAKKLAEKGETSACVEDSVVYGWAIHYFEENSIEGTLYNEDGTEYKPAPKVKPKAASAPAAPPKPKAEPQLSLFDMLSNNSAEESAAPVENDEEPTEEEIREAMEQEISSPPSTIPAPPKKPQGSPMYQRYLSVKEKYKDCIVLYRLGDFYEMFGEDAITSANELELTLTGRDCGLAERVPMTGIPFHAADVYISKLVSRGYKVAVAEPVSGGNREVKQVIEPESVSPSVINEEVGEILSGDIKEPKDMPAVTDIDDDFDLEKEREIAKAFDKDALIILSELLGDIFTLE